MEKRKKQEGALSIEASISYSLFLMIMVTILYLMRIVYVYGLVQHAVSQTAKELSMYSYLYQVGGLNDLNQQIAGATADRTKQFNGDVEDVIQFYNEFSSGNVSASYNGTTDPREIFKNIGAALLGEAGKEINHQLFEAAARPMLESYIGADAQGNGADARLQALQVVGGINGLNFGSSRFFEDGATIDLIVCYTIDPIMPVDILPELNLANRACIRGMGGTSVFKEVSQEKKSGIWDNPSATGRGKAIQEQEKVRNLPENFPAFSAYDPSSKKATAETSIDLSSDYYQTISGIKGRIRKSCQKMDNFKDTTYDGVTIKAKDIQSKELIIYIPSSTGERKIDRTLYEQAVKEVQEQYPEIHIVTKEID